MVLLHVDADAASAIALSVAEAIRDVSVVAGGGATVGATASVGLAMIDRESADHQEILVQADRAMYDAKAAGRDRVAPAH